MAPVTSRHWPAPTASSNFRPDPTPFRKDSWRGSSAGERVSTEHVMTFGRTPVDTLRRPIHDLRISVMDRCNFRCPYCMPRETFHESYRFLKSNERLDFTELLRL